MSSVSDDRGAGAGPFDPEGAEASSTVDVVALRRGVKVGRAVAVVAPLAVVVEAAAWLLLGPVPLRTALAWSCTAALALCAVALFAARSVSPSVGKEAAYRTAWRTGLRGSSSRWWRLVLAGFMFPAFVAMLFGVGASAMKETSDIHALAETETRVVAASVKKVQPLGKTGDGRFGYRARYEVQVPEGRNFSVEFVNEEQLNEGDTVYVGYAPGRPELQPIADDERSEVEQQLSGRPMDFRVWLGVLIAWAGGTVALLVWLIRGAGGAGPLPGGRMKRAERGMAAAPAQIKGFTQYRVSRPNKSPVGLLGLKVHSGGQEIAFGMPGCNAKYAGDVLAGESGQLEWPDDLPEEPIEDRLVTTPVDFVTSDGRRLSGSVPTQALQALTARGAAHALAPRPEPARATADAVDLGATWPLTLPRSVLLLLLAAVLLPAPLFAVPHAGGWGVALLVCSGAAVAAAGVVTLVRDHKHTPRTG